MNEGNIVVWLADWTSPIDLVSEIQARLTVKVTRDVLSTNIKRRFAWEAQPARLIYSKSPGQSSL